MAEEEAEEGARGGGAEEEEEEDAGDGNDCAVCRDSLSEDLTVLPCGHVYHASW